MENYKTIIDFIFLNKKRFKIQFKRILQTEQYIKNCYDIYASINIDGKTYFGRSTSNNFDKSLVVAFLESIERYIFASLKLNLKFSSAIHFDKNQSIENSVNELIERDCVLWHHLNRSSFVKLEPYNSQLNDLLGIDYLKSESFGRLIIVSKLYLLKKPNNYILGFGCSHNLDEAVQKSKLEVIRNVHLVKASRFKLQLKRFLGSANLKHLYAVRLSNNISDFQYLDHESHQNTFVEPSDSIITKTVCAEDVDLRLKDLNCYFSYSHSNDFIGLYNNINEANLNRIGLKCVSDLNKSYHPVG